MNKTFISYIFLSVISSMCYNEFRNISILIHLRRQSGYPQLIRSYLYRQVSLTISPHSQLKQENLPESEKDTFKYETNNRQYKTQLFPRPQPDAALGAACRHAHLRDHCTALLYSGTRLPEQPAQHYRTADFYFRAPA